MLQPRENTQDTLTGLPTSAGFRTTLEDLMRQADGKNTPLTLALVDLDWFGRINDEHGTTVGDAVLRLLAGHLAEACGPGCTVVRHGGDAFMVVFEGVEKEQAFLRVEAARQGFDREHLIEAAGTTTRLQTSISAGVAAFPDDGNTVAALLRKATDAVYRAKVTHRNKVCLAREEKMVTKTTYYTQGQLEGLSRLAKREGMSEAVLLREALDDLFSKHNS